MCKIESTKSQICSTNVSILKLRRRKISDIENLINEYNINDTINSENNNEFLLNSIESINNVNNVEHLAFHFNFSLTNQFNSLNQVRQIHQNLLNMFNNVDQFYSSGLIALNRNLRFNNLIEQIDRTALNVIEENSIRQIERNEQVLHLANELQFNSSSFLSLTTGITLTLFFGGIYLYFSWNDENNNSIFNQPVVISLPNLNIKTKTFTILEGSVLLALIKKILFKR